MQHLFEISSIAPSGIPNFNACQPYKEIFSGAGFGQEGHANETSGISQGCWNRS
jgi:hypothetical protein